MRTVGTSKKKSKGYILKERMDDDYSFNLFLLFLAFGEIDDGG